MTEDELIIYSERAVAWAYSKFYLKNSHHKDDLLQEARLRILEEYRNTKFNDDRFKNLLPKYAIQGMIQFLRSRYHLRSKNGYMEISVDEIYDTRATKNYALAEWLLFYDVHKVIETIKLRTSACAIREIMDKVYQGYNFEEIGVVLGRNGGNVCRTSKLVGKQLLSAWGS